MPLISKQQPPYYTTTENTKIYKAILNQTGTAVPTTNVLINTIGTITTGRNDVGEYYLLGTGLFTEEKTYIQINTDGEVGQIITTAGWSSEDAIKIFNYSGISTLADEMTAYITITVNP